MTVSPTANRMIRHPVRGGRRTEHGPRQSVLVHLAQLGLPLTVRFSQ